ncbi:MucBP domain-containing protein [Enterococcus rivorum]|uniref:Gram-positive cocci surface proteins LPxTG domain-containing protein n=1 Tax=Enterococcus rivorum TaxID=762845 RepID=A0A1E5KUV9_9ENTE|nr:MucBP domain-containing protein [Enterococcus rivorum]MBP2100442.1 LPXTG-motif cell wall-anchored protein [Enterococcus rivorum]OEH81675.1 hypothetical protein BCR26_15805 [Enterococcus rivorum]
MKGKLKTISIGLVVCNLLLPFNIVFADTISESEMAKTGSSMEETTNTISDTVDTTKTSEIESSETATTDTINKEAEPNGTTETNKENIQPAAQQMAIQAASTTIDTVADLQTALSGASEGDTITLGDNFTTNITATMTLTVPNVNVTIDGNGKTLTTSNNIRLLTIAGNGTGSIRLTNITLSGANGGSGATTTQTGKAIFDNVVFDSFATGGDGSALHVGGNQTEIVNSTFSNNINSATGYSGGAIAGKGFNGQLTVKNSKFINNENKALGSVVGGEGGAMFFYNPSANAKFLIENCYFEGNKAVENATGSAAKLADGGAITFFNIVQGVQIDINGSTFYKNIAGDDGGAILIQTNSNISSGVTLYNNTFYQNLAQGADASANSGGAIQIYANGSPTQGNKALIDYVNNTFYDNEATYRGGAIGSSGYLTNLSAGRYQNNLFVGNRSNGAGYNNIADSSVAGSGDLGGNIGFDNGKASTVTVADVFGVYPVSLIPNSSGISAGATSDNTIIPTLPIAPEKAANQKGTISNYTVDQRGYSRSADLTDIGATEIFWIKYDSNGGTFSMNELSAYDGTVYYEGTEPTAYYQVSYDGAQEIVPSGVDNLKAHKENSTFLGWSTDAAATQPDVNYSAGTSLNILASNITLYAVWAVQAADVTVHYLDEAGKTIADDVVLSGNVGDTYTSSQKVIAGYTFKEVQGAATGTFTDTAQEVTYVYTKDVPKEGKVIVHYVDESGKELAKDVTLTGTVGTDYKADQKAIAGYTFKEFKGQATGKYEETVQEVTYVYTKDIVKEGKVIVHYVDESGKELAKDVTLTGTVGTDYQADQKAIAGYTFKELKGQVTGKYTEATQEITYVYTKNDDTKPSNSDDTKKLPNTYNNRTGNRLPRTGEKQSLWLTIGGGLLLLLGASYLLKRKKSQ